MPESPPAPVDVLIVGAGITGIYQLYRAREAGFSVQLLEAGDGAGGTWYWNRYPGARFDSESYTYAYLFSEELFDEWEWHEHFADQPEIERYLNHVVDRFDLRRHIRFGAKVAAAVYDEPSGAWTVTLADGRELHARFLVAARVFVDTLLFVVVEVSINAGMDMVMVPEDYIGFFNTLKSLVQAGKVPQARIDDAVTRILRVKIAMGMMDPKRNQLADRSLHKTFGSPDHRNVARQCVRKSLVLLKNDNRALPLARNAAHPDQNNTWPGTSRWVGDADWPARSPMLSAATTP